MQPEPSSSNIQDPPKHEEMFLPFEARLSRLSTLKKISFIAALASLLQIVFGFALIFVNPSLFNICLTAIGVFSLALCGLALYWINSCMTKEEQVTTLFSQKQDNKSTLLLLLCSLLKLTQAPLLIMSLILQKSYIHDFLVATRGSEATLFELDNENIKGLYSSNFPESLISAYIAMEIIIFLYILSIMATSFKLVQKPKKMGFYFISILNIIMLGFSFAIIYNINRVLDLEDYQRMESLFPRWNLYSLLIIGYICVGLSLPVWFINHKKWRIGFLITSLIVLTLGLCLMTMLIHAYIYSNDIYLKYSNTEDAEKWQMHMVNVSKEQIENYGCPSKYLPASSSACNNQEIVIMRETSNFDLSSEYCLNKYCSGLLGQVYSDKFLQITNLSFELMIILNMTFIVSGLMSTTQVNIPKTKSWKRSNFIWLAPLIFVAFIGLLANGSYYNQSIQKYQDNQIDHKIETDETWDENRVKDSIDNTIFIHKTPSRNDYHVASSVISSPQDSSSRQSRAVVLSAGDMRAHKDVPLPSGKYFGMLTEAPTIFLSESNEEPQPPTSNVTLETKIHVNPNAKEAIHEMSTSRKYDYLILGLSHDDKEIIILDQGKTGNSYDAFVNKVNHTIPQIAILDLSVEKTDKFVVVIYIPHSINETEKDVFVSKIIPHASELTLNEGQPVLVTSNSSDLALENLLKYTFQLSDKHLNATDSTSQARLRKHGIQASQKTISSVVFRLKGHNIDPDVEKSLNELIAGRQYKYVLLNWNTTKNLLCVATKAPKNATYNDFVKQFVPGQSQIALLDFQFEDKDVPVLISWNSELIYSQPWQAQVYQLLLTEVSTLNIPYYEPHDINALALNNLIDFLVTFWPLQVNTYSKYNPKELLSVLKSPDFAKTPESILRPLFDKEETEGESVLTEMLLRRKYKYLLFKEVEENGEIKLIFQKAAPKEATMEDFLQNVKGNGNQLALLYLEFLNQDKIVCLVMTESTSLERNYVNYARIASAAEVYDIPTAYVTSPEKIELEQLTLFTFTPEILHLLDDVKVDAAIKDNWDQYAKEGKHGYTILQLKENYSQLKIIKAVEGDNVTLSDFEKDETTNKQPFYALLNLNDLALGAQIHQPFLLSKIPSDTDKTAKILYKQVEAILAEQIPGVQIRRNLELQLDKRY